MASTGVTACPSRLRGSRLTCGSWIIFLLQRAQAGNPAQQRSPSITERSDDRPLEINIQFATTFIDLVLSINSEHAPAPFAGDNSVGVVRMSHLFSCPRPSS